VQTFLPLPSFAASARVLDQRRLGKQRVEALQILRALTVPGYGWRHHPAAKMWAGYTESLVRYGLEVCAVWRRAGRPDTCAATLVAELAACCGIQRPRTQAKLAAAGELPPWLGMTAFHESHQSALVRKNPNWYRHFFPDVPDDLPYVWPASDRNPEVPSS
jgi:Pyrimidine dimer DNA glycosylase